MAYHITIWIDKAGTPRVGTQGLARYKRAFEEFGCLASEKIDAIQIPHRKAVLKDGEWMIVLMSDTREFEEVKYFRGEKVAKRI